jgi:hypothetical protein
MLRLPKRATAVLVASLSVGCGGEPTGFTAPVSVTRFFTSVYAWMPGGAGASAAPIVKVHLEANAAAAPVRVDGVLRAGRYASAAGAPAATITLESSVVTGTPAKVRVTADAPFTHVVLSVPGTSDYWEVELPSAVSEVQVVPTAASAIPNPEFPLEAAVGSAAGYGRPAQQAIQAVDLANSDIAVILRWNALSDVDLHVTDAKGTKVYFANPLSAEGGRLDLDSNPACRIDGVNQEVITWPLGRAPAGDYKVEVDYWADCGVVRSDYTVTYMIRGRTIEVVEGSFPGLASNFPTREIARFRFP